MTRTRQPLLHTREVALHSAGTLLHKVTAQSANHALSCRVACASMRIVPVRALEEVRVPQRLTYTVPEVAELLGISRSTAYECIRRGEIPALVLGRRIVVSRAALKALLDRSEARVGTEARP